ncbi:Ni/Fe-hydrogenase, b-type cytochrome subunit [Anaerosinus massiliensis]|uniref:Ni/Fe-hydrogenase, b-type cytochrome subunit n=1 Tax=Massilibacillus massiliensis TaxID=1806837 RepID=UPI000A7B9C01|nr:Ni/Fe-hydrogenase, b-type cytochrome subunit [Massilibacillus massiliensis]
MKKEPRFIYYLFSPFLRIFHWIMVFCTIVLFVTGLWITKPLSGGVSMEPIFGSILLSLHFVRYMHSFAAFIFVAAFILRIYGFVMYKGDRLFPRFWEEAFWRGSKDVLLHYMFLRPSHKPYLRNPLARISYVAIYSMMLIQIVTGFAMRVTVDPNAFGAGLFSWIIRIWDSEFMLHLIHHYVAWLIVFVTIPHIYMVVREDFMEREGEVSSMFSGVKIFKHKPLDLRDIVDEKNTK